MLIKTIDAKIKMTYLIAFSSFVFSLLLTAIGLQHAYSVLNNSRENVYVLDHGVPVLLRATSQSVNRPAEYKAHIKLFHSLFFNLPPDDSFIKSNLEQAMYLIDETGQIEYNNLKEKGYYNSILASSSVLSIRCTNIEIDYQDNTFIYSGIQTIERKTRVTTRELITTGSFIDVPRSDYNAHGCLITNWKTISNKDLKNEVKGTF